MLLSRAVSLAQGEASALSRPVDCAGSRQGLPREEDTKDTVTDLFQLPLLSPTVQTYLWTLPGSQI